MKWTTSLLLTFMIFVLLLGAWLDQISSLTKASNRACRVSASENQADMSSSTSMEFQHVLDEYSTQKGGIGLQVTVIFPDAQTWNGAVGYADIDNQCPLRSAITST